VETHARMGGTKKQRNCDSFFCTGGKDKKPVQGHTGGLKKGGGGHGACSITCGGGEGAHKGLLRGGGEKVGKTTHKKTRNPISNWLKKQVSLHQLCPEKKEKCSNSW